MVRKLTLVGLLVAGLPGCDPCGPFERQYFDVIGARAILLQQPVGATYQVLTAGQPVATAALRLRLALDTRLYSAAPIRVGGFAALACSPLEPEYTETVDSVTVTSRYDYDAQHPAGTPLNDLVRVDEGAGSSISLAQLLAAPQLAGRLDGRALSFAQGPSQPSTQQFRVRYHQTNGEAYSAETVAVEVRP